MLVIEPTVEASDLLSATERYWRPALNEPSLHFDVRVIDEHGHIHHPRPKSNTDLRSFISAYEVATTPQDNKRPDVRRREYHQSGSATGVLGMAAEIPGWSRPEYSEVETGIDHRSLIALVRSPRMVVEYFDTGRISPFVRGIRRGPVCQ